MDGPDMTSVSYHQQCVGDHLDAACNAARILAHRLTLKGDAAFAGKVLSGAGIDATALVQREATGRDVA